MVNVRYILLQRRSRCTRCWWKHLQRKNGSCGGKTATSEPGHSGKKLIENMLMGSPWAKLPSMTQVGISLNIHLLETWTSHWPRRKPILRGVLVKLGEITMWPRYEFEIIVKTGWENYPRIVCFVANLLQNLTDLLHCLFYFLGSKFYAEKGLKVHSKWDVK